MAAKASWHRNYVTVTLCILTYLLSGTQHGVETGGGVIVVAEKCQNVAYRTNQDMILPNFHVTEASATLYGCLLYPQTCVNVFI